ncbi:uncharacterized protein PFL1_03179 [Pseudozyma flocculosa PF-1]|uniref:Uncharacterized protein n=1 Tax=Pseudozyma flocculosa PF-1 TaxID=1277687 RepID=A0A061HAC1_9BASI|nr:uncharacterized protein PFL1_03179 [Pseudozyma flocculosa PF-1]EPQ29424.1 hypothetical protein PFL1_03179 [Pseudozyma flocculosa PF-1]
MYCLRWWIPLFLVPFPKVSPFFLILFLLSFTLHSRPCVYCALILFGLFATSVNWYPELGLGPSPVTMTTSTQEAISPKPEAAPFYPGSILASIDAAPTGSAVPTQTGIVPPAVEQVLLLWLGLDVERVVVPEKVFVGLGRAGGLGFWINLVPGGGEGPPAAPIRTFTS